MSWLDPIHALFNHSVIRKIWVKTRFFWLILGIVLVIYFRLPKAQYFWYGFILSLLGEIVQLWCFASLDKKGTLAQNGLYAVVRNPMYLGRWLMIIGFMMVLGNLYWVIATIIIYWFYMVNRVKREEIVLKEIFGHEYEEYCAKVGRFIPRPGVNWKNVPFFSWRLLMKNHGILNFLGVLVLYVLLYWAVFVRT